MAVMSKAISELHQNFKGGCAHFTMCILHFQLIDLDL